MTLWRPDCTAKLNPLFKRTVVMGLFAGLMQRICKCRRGGFGPSHEAKDLLCGLQTH